MLLERNLTERNISDLNSTVYLKEKLLKSYKKKYVEYNNAACSIQMCTYELFHCVQKI